MQKFKVIHIVISHFVCVCAKSNADAWFVDALAWHIAHIDHWRNIGWRYEMAREPRMHSTHVPIISAQTDWMKRKIKTIKDVSVQSPTMENNHKINYELCRVPQSKYQHINIQITIMWIY